MGDEFREWVAGKIRERNDKLAEKHDLMIDMDPAIARAFQNSSMISSKYLPFNIPYSIRTSIIVLLVSAVNGRGVHILKAGSKRRRTQADMAEQLN